MATIREWGAARRVAGSNLELIVNGKRHLHDCGLFYNNELDKQPFPYDPKSVETVTLGHGHMDHIGRLLKLFKEGFRGSIYCTGGTADITKLQLQQKANSAYIENKRVEEYNKWVKGRKFESGPNKGKFMPFMEKVRSEYTYQDYKNLMQLFEFFSSSEGKYKDTIWDPNYDSGYSSIQLGYPYEETIPISDDIIISFHQAGHIMGSAQTLFQIKENGKTITFLADYDLGRIDIDTPIVKQPKTNFKMSIDYIGLEATYGDKTHDPLEESLKILEDAINETYKKKGCLVIPAFSIMRTHLLEFYIHELYKQGKIPKDMPFILSSPSAEKVNRIILKHKEDLDKVAKREMVGKVFRPFAFPTLEIHKKVAETKDLLEQSDKAYPYAIIASSGMCEGGRIERILKEKLPDLRTVVLLTGYQAAGTRGRLLEEGAKEVPFLRGNVKNNATIMRMGGLSGHADSNEQIQHLKKVNPKGYKGIFIKHGESQSCDAFREKLIEAGFDKKIVHVMEKGQAYELV